MLQFDPNLLPQNSEPSNGYTIRPLHIDDYDKGYLNILAQLTTVGDIPKDKFQSFFKESIGSGKYYLVIESNGKIVGAGSIQIEKKFIHGCACVGHIEDIVVDDSTRGTGLGKKLILTLLDLGKALTCYKVILDCAEKNVGFYEKCGLVRKEVMMAKYFQ